MSEKRRSGWIARLGRADLDRENANKYKICATHFLSGSPAAIFDTLNPDWSPTLHLGDDKGKVNMYTGNQKGKARTPVGITRYRRLKPRESYAAPGRGLPESELHFVQVVACDAVDHAPIVNDCTTNISGTTMEAVECTAEDPPREFESKPILPELAILPDFPSSPEAETPENLPAQERTGFLESGCQTDLTAASIDALEKEVLQLNAEILAAKIKIEPVEVAPDLARDQNQQAVEPENVGDCLGRRLQQQCRYSVGPATWDAAVQTMPPCHDAAMHRNAATQVWSSQLIDSRSIGIQVNFSVRDATSCAVQTDPAVCDNRTDEDTVATVSHRTQQSQCRASFAVPLKRCASPCSFACGKKLKEENTVDGDRSAHLNQASNEDLHVHDNVVVKGEPVAT